MEGGRLLRPSLLWLLLAVIFSHGFFSQVMSIRSLNGFADQKTYYSSPDPHSGSTGTPPKHGGCHTHKKPDCECPTPSHGGGHHGGGSSKAPPSHGGGGYYPSPPTTVSPPSGGGGGFDPNTPPITVTPPSSGGGGYYGSTPPITVTPPSSGGGGYYGSTPPATLTPPSSPPFDPYAPSPLVPTTPTTPTILPPPAPPLIPDPNIPPFFPGTVNYWRSHPAAIWALFGYWGTVGGFFGMPAAAGFGTNLSLQQALANRRSDGIGALYREGTAAFLNSLVNRSFPLTTQQVKESFAAAVVSNRAAAAQAELFEKANEGHLNKH